MGLSFEPHWRHTAFNCRRGLTTQEIASCKCCADRERYGEKTMANRLASETSPYLLQHANNPVDWYPWCDEALAQAQKLNKPILLSVGYAACHWCHVMAHE